MPAAASDAVLWKRRVAGRRREEVKTWLAVRKAGRETRNMGVGVMVREEITGSVGLVGCGWSGGMGMGMPIDRRVHSGCCCQGSERVRVSAGWVSVFGENERERERGKREKWPMMATMTFRCSAAPNPGPRNKVPMGNKNGDRILSLGQAPPRLGCPDWSVRGLSGWQLAVGKAR